MASSLLNLANNLSEEIHWIKYKFGHDDKICEEIELKCKYYDCFLEHTNSKDNLIIYKRLCCNKNYQHEFDEKL